MAFSTLLSDLIQVGKPIIKSIFTTLKTNQDDLNTRMLTVEASANKIILFDGPVLSAGAYASVTGLLFFRVPSSIDITDVKVGIFAKGAITSGVLEIDLQKSDGLDFTSSVSVFNTKPSLDLAVANDYEESSNTVLSSLNKVLLEGDYLRLDITSLPVGLARFQIYAIGEPS